MNTIAPINIITTGTAKIITLMVTFCPSSVFFPTATEPIFLGIEITSFLPTNSDIELIKIFLFDKKLKNGVIWFDWSWPYGIDTYDANTLFAKITAFEVVSSLIFLLVFTTSGSNLQSSSSSVLFASVNSKFLLKKLVSEVVTRVWYSIPSSTFNLAELEGSGITNECTYNKIDDNTLLLNC